jgi:dipeptide/tripeptide permease
MDEISISLFNASCCMLLSFVSAWACLSHRVKDGPVIKLGLIFMSIGFFFLGMTLIDGHSNSDIQAVDRSLVFIHLGLVLAVIGVIMRIRRHGHKLRRVSDWVELDDEPVSRSFVDSRAVHR